MHGLFNSLAFQRVDDIGEEDFDKAIGVKAAAGKLLTRQSDTMLRKRFNSLGEFIKSEPTVQKQFLYDHLFCHLF